MRDQEPPIHEYLGDGAYVTFTGHDLQVKANDHRCPTDTVCLGRREVEAFVRFAQRVGMLSSPVQVENTRGLQDFQVRCNEAALLPDASVVERVSEKCDGHNSVSVSVVLNRIPVGWSAAYCRELGMHVPDDIPDCAVVGQDGKSFEWVTLDFTVGRDGCLQENPGDYEA